MEDPEYPFRVLIDDENFIHGGSRNNSFATIPSRSTTNKRGMSKFGTQKYGKQRSQKFRRRKTNKKFTSIASDATSSSMSTDCECSDCCRDSESTSERFSDSTVSIVSDQKRYQSHESKSDSGDYSSPHDNASERSFQIYSDDNAHSENYSDNSDHSKASSEIQHYSTRVPHFKSRTGHIGHDMYHSAKPGVDEIHSIIFNTVSKELEQLKDKGFNYPAGYDPSTQTLENNEITLFALRLQEQRVNNRNRIKGFIKIASMIFSVVCQWAKIKVLDTENFVRDISASVAAGEYDAFIDMIEPDLQNNMLTHPFTSMFVKFVDTASESSENRKREKRAEQTTKEANERKVAKNEKLQAIFAKMPRTETS